MYVHIVNNCHIIDALSNLSIHINQELTSENNLNQWLTFSDFRQPVAEAVRDEDAAAEVEQHRQHHVLPLLLVVLRVAEKHFSEYRLDILSPGGCIEQRYHSCFSPSGPPGRNPGSAKIF